MVKVPFVCGDGTTAIEIEVSYIAEFPRDEWGRCAFCHGDPCAEDSPPDSLIVQYFERNRTWATACPCCDGRAT